MLIACISYSDMIHWKYAKKGGAKTIDVGHGNLHARRIDCRVLRTVSDNKLARGA